MYSNYSPLSILNQQIETLYKQVKELSCNNTTEIMRTTAVVEKLLMQYHENTELLILQTHLEILNSREQRARAFATKVWEIGGNIDILFEKMYLDDLLNLGLLDMALILIKPRFEDIASNIETFPLEMIKFAIMTGSTSLLKKIARQALGNNLLSAIDQFADVYQQSHYEEAFKNIQKIVIESFGNTICAYDYNIYTDRGFTDIEISLYFSNYELDLQKHHQLLENKISAFCITSGIKRIHNLSFVCRNIKDHPKF